MSLSFGVLVIFLVGLGALTSNADYLPALNQIHRYSFAAPYSCGGSYPKSALFLSDYSLNRNAPDLLYNGACGSQRYFESSTAGDDFSLISLIGKYPIQNVSASRAFNFDRVVGGDNIFKENQPATPLMTYAALLSKSDIRALFAFRVLFINSTGACDIEYAVLSYSIQNVREESPGFGWSTENYYPYGEPPTTYEVPFSSETPDSQLKPNYTVVLLVLTVVTLGLLGTVIFLLVDRRRRAGYTPIQYGQTTPQIQMN